MTVFGYTLIWWSNLDILLITKQSFTDDFTFITAVNDSHKLSLPNIVNKRKGENKTHLLKQPSILAHFYKSLSLFLSVTGQQIQSFTVQIIYKSHATVKLFEVMT